MNAFAHGLILASSSPYRKQQLTKLGHKFNTQSPNIDESRRNGETPSALVQRLSYEKALAIQKSFPKSTIIGSDQVAYIKEAEKGSPLSTINVLTKPNSISNAIHQLTACSGKSVRFVTGLCCLSPTYDAQIISEYVDVTFRQLSQREIQNYINIEKPLDCAGSFKVEGLGITLFDKVESTDPNTLIGLPLIALNKMLINIGLNSLLA
ncbi:MAG: MAF protein [Bermanella sp.]|jgi:MAF protein|uniref:Maf family protein n=1 Tax=Glaciecola sp. 33A TaxID=2057807 RepID=UPI000C32B0E0|nr:Maf family protein [Glaciecola sp. 33A]PKI00351.1 septum formation protein Maf [Glaciecola sp. 33A]